MKRVGVLLLAGLLLGLVGCGGGNGSPGTSRMSESGTDPQGGGNGAATQSQHSTPKKDASPRRDAPGITIATEDSQFGTILFDGDHQAIYLFEKESSDRSECYGDCAVAWPPVLTKGSPRASGAVSARLLGTTARRDGTTQVTYNDHPLYYYERDPRGQVLCQNVVEFGGRWLVVDPEGNAVE